LSPSRLQITIVSFWDGSLHVTNRKLRKG